MINIKHTILFCFAIFAVFSHLCSQDKDESFLWKAEKNNENQILVTVEVADNRYLYYDSTRVSVFSSRGVPLKLLNAPKAEKYIDEFRQENLVLKTAKHIWIFETDGNPPYNVVIRYQGCSKKPFLCYPPANKEIKIEGSIIKNAINSAVKEGKKITDISPPEIKNPEKIADENSLLGKFFSKGGWWIFFAALLAGLLSTLTPCVLPLIPITVAILPGSDKEKEKNSSFFKVILYVAGIIIMFTALAIFAAFSGKAFGSQILGNRIAVIIFSSLFFILSLSMFGLYDLQLPSSLQTKLSNIGGGAYFGAFFMGLAAGLIAVPCTGPVLGVLLGIAAASANPLFSVSLLFSYACGFGLPFLFIGSGAKILPKSGFFMEWIKSLLGIAIMVLAIYGFSIAIPELKTLFSNGTGFAKIASLLLIFAGFLLGAIHSDGHSPKLSVRFAKIAGAVSLSFGLVWNLMLPASAEKSVKWIKYDKSIYQEAQKTNKHILLDFTAEWCAACKEMDATTFKTETVIKELSSHWLTVKIDCTVNTAETDELVKKYNVKGFPGFVVISPDGKVKESFTGFHNANSFLQKLQKLKTEK